MSVVRPFQSLVRTRLALSKTGRFLSKAEILGVGVFSLSNFFVQNEFLHVLVLCSGGEHLLPRSCTIMNGIRPSHRQHRCHFGVSSPISEQKQGSKNAHPSWVPFSLLPSESSYSQTHQNLQGQRAVIPSERVQLWACLFLYGQSLRWCETTPGLAEWDAAVRCHGQKNKIQCFGGFARSETLTAHTPLIKGVEGHPLN